MCLSIGLTAAKLGASIANYCEVVEILKSTDPTTNKEVVSGARVLDRTTGKEFALNQSQVHIPRGWACWTPATATAGGDFLFTWQNCTIAEIKHYLSPDIDIRVATCSALGPAFGLVTDPNKSDTQSIARNHIIEVSDSRMVTIAGGKWTTYRQMSEETIDKVIEVANLQAKGPCKTKGLLLDGAYHWGPNLFIRLVQEYGVEPSVALSTWPMSMATSLWSGQRWPVVGKRLHPNYPYLESEVRLATREYACRAVDILARRTAWPSPMCTAAVEACPEWCRSWARKLGWSETKRRAGALQTVSPVEMGYNLKLQERLQHPSICPLMRLPILMSKFRKMDADNKGFITLNDLERYFKLFTYPHFVAFRRGTNHSMEAAQIMDMIDEVDLNRNGRIEMSEFLQFMSAAKSGTVGSSRFKHVLDRTSHSDKDHVISVDRSGGGV
uniref:glycerol-3-phosphate dehydrogenase n=1 Tax=Macrostomum lignano TaxID=282301 RepID=A0A1I8FFR6_9PLAT